MSKTKSQSGDADKGAEELASGETGVATTPDRNSAKASAEKSMTREERLAEALRANLRRRKSAARARKDEA